MKTRTSIKTTFILTGLIASLIMARLFFVLMFNYYKEGTATTTRTFLQDAALLSNKDHPNSAGIIIHSNWQAFPDDFKLAIKQPPNHNQPFIKGSLETPILHSPSALYFVLFTQNSAGQSVYSGKRLNWTATDVAIGELSLSIYWRAFVLSIIFALALTALLLFILKYLVTPLETLKRWAQIISSDTQLPPDINMKFRFREFSDIAEVIRDNINRKEAALAREQEFLQFSSHEMRTPLAAIKNNIELLCKLSQNSPENHRTVIQRINHCTTILTNTVNTFLWLSREQPDYFHQESIKIQPLINQITEELIHILDGKEVTVTLDIEPNTLNLPFSPCHIVLSNLISNAFKHAFCGEVSIVHTGTCVCVVNNHQNTEQEKDDSGFGLGLKLVEKVAGKFNWHFQTKRTHHQFIATLDFDS